MNRFALLLVGLFLSTQSFSAGKKECLQKWSEFVKHNPKGWYTVYNHNNENGGVKSSVKVKKTVLDSSDKVVKFASVMTVKGKDYKQSTTMKKDTFVQYCMDNKDVPVNVIDTGKEEIKVPAGTFKTEWTEYDMETDGWLIEGKNWVAKVKKIPLTIKHEWEGESDDGVTATGDMVLAAYGNVDDN